MAGFILTDRNGHFRVEDTDAQTPMSKCMNLYVLDRDEEQIGDDTPVSGGKSLNPRRGDGFRETLEWIIRGDVDHAGLAHADRVAGLRANIRWIRSNITLPTGVGDDATRSLEVEWNDGIVTTARGRVGPLTLGSMRGDGCINAAFDVWIPVGAFVAA